MVSMWVPGSKQPTLFSTCLLALCLLCLPTMHADVLPVQEAAFMVAGSKLYIQGGKKVFWANGIEDLVVREQLLSLDLAENWPTSAPKWNTSLTPGGAVFHFVGVAASDNKTLITFKDNASPTELYVSTYDITSNIWNPISALVLPPDNRGAIRAVVDPTTSLVYINSDFYMHVFDPRSYMINNATRIEGNIIPLRRYAGAAYLKSRKRIIYFGGLDGNIKYGLMEIWEFSPQTGEWAIWKTTGDIPSQRTDHCLATNEDGSTVVVYGGRTPPSDTSPPSNFTGTFYTLDVATATWTKGEGTSPRLYMACVIIGDQFLAWGGYDGNSTIDGPPIVYSLTQKAWVNNYTAPAYMKSLATGANPVTAPKTSSPPPTGPSPASSSPNLGAILGGIFGGLFVVAAAGTIHMFMKRREDRIKYDAVAQKKDKSDNEKDGSSNSIMQTQDCDSSSPRNPQKLLESQFRTHAARNPQNVPSDMMFQERANGPQQHYSGNNTGIIVTPQSVNISYTAGISTAATTMSDRLGVSSSHSVAPTTFDHGSGFYSAPVSEVSSGNAAMMSLSDSSDTYHAQPIVPTTVTNGIPVYMTSSGQYVGLVRQPIQTPGAAGYVMGYSGPAMSHSSGTSSMVAEPLSSAHTVFANLPSSTPNSAVSPSMSDSGNSIGYFASPSPSWPNSGQSETGPNSTMATASSVVHDTVLTDASAHLSTGTGSMVAGPPSSAHTVFSSRPLSTLNSALYSSTSAGNSVGCFPAPGLAQSKSGLSTTDFDSTLVAPSHSAHNTVLTDASTQSSSGTSSMMAGPPSSVHTAFSSMPPSTVNSTVYSSTSALNSVGQLP